MDKGFKALQVGALMINQTLWQRLLPGTYSLALDCYYLLVLALAWAGTCRTLGSVPPQ